MSYRKWLYVAALCVGGSSTLAQDYLPILQYHHVDASTPRSTSVSPEEFQAHMDYLNESGFQVVDLASALKDIRSGKSLPDKAVAITFDDAYRNIYKNGFPILKAHQFPFTVFINTGPVEQHHASFLTWDQMKEMQASGAVFANHTVSHPYMLRRNEGESFEQWQVRMTNEVAEVERLLVDKLGDSPKMLAYPYGESNSVIRAQMNEQGMIAFGQQSGVVSKTSDFTNLPRFPAAGHYADLKTLKVKLASKPMPLLSFNNHGDFADDTPVSITLTLKDGQYRSRDLVCYVAGQGKAELTWLNKKTVKVDAQAPFNVGRGRINCTMPDQSGRHYYWFSNVWIHPAKDQGYVTEKIKKN